ncbi:DUF952 domain-containing protein [Sphingomonas sp. ID0503]|uniref:DUF952 domain-containing protein n=1 Tax=Sphingomonas sp. ID0503 TaxID=3399691 RepID=UPI003AFA6179
MSEATVYKVLTAEQMAGLEETRSFAGSPDDQRDGFIHLSTAAQLPGTLERHFAGQADLHLCAVDTDAAGKALKWEVSRGGDLFPHLYAPLTLDEVVAYSPLAYEPDGSLRLPVTG